MLEPLRPDEEELVIELLAEFSDQARDEEAVSLDPYLDRCPNTRVRERLQTLVVVSQLMECNAALRRDERLRR